MPSSHLHSTTSYLSVAIRFSNHGLSTPQPISTSATTLPLSTLIGIKTNTLKRFALVPSFYTSLVSLSRQSSSNTHFNSGRNILYRATETPREDITPTCRYTSLLATEGGASQNIILLDIPTNIQPANGLTKRLPKQRHQNWESLLHFNSFPSK
jgi:hypothetical protein